MSSSSELSLLPNSHDPSNPLILVSLSHILKLTPTNYIAWKSQIESTLLGLDSYHFLDGSQPIPDETLTTSTSAVAATTETPAKPAVTTTSPNPAFKSWFRQDKLILSALSSTLSPSLLSLISLCTTTQSAWQTLTKTYANPSKGHLKQLKDRLRTISKGSRSITDFMQDFKNCSDQLTSLGKPLDPDDIIDRILDQINDPEYDSVISAIQHRETPITFDELHEKLINREFAIKLKNRTTPFPASVNLGQKPNPSPSTS